VAKELSFQTGEDLIAEIGFGKISPRQVLGRLRPRLVDKEEGAQGLVSKVVSRLTRPKTDVGIKVDGVSDMLLHFAKCCQPLPGEKVVGFITRGSGVAIHNENCRYVKEADPDRLVKVTWEPSEKNIYPAKLRVITLEGKGVLADISDSLQPERRQYHPGRSKNHGGQ
jgi:guanosine-3',5'-bis(diphosphate) 3'-pyrophosphohydrolase